MLTKSQEKRLCELVRFSSLTLGRRHLDTYLLLCYRASLGERPPIAQLAPRTHEYAIRSPLPLSNNIRWKSNSCFRDAFNFRVKDSGCAGRSHEHLLIRGTGALVKGHAMPRLMIKDADKSCFRVKRNVSG